MCIYVVYSYMRAECCMFEKIAWLLNGKKNLAWSKSGFQSFTSISNFVISTNQLTSAVSFHVAIIPSALLEEAEIKVVDLHWFPVIVLKRLFMCVAYINSLMIHTSTLKLFMSLVELLKKILHYKNIPLQQLSLLLTMIYDRVNEVTKKNDILLHYDILIYTYNFENWGILNNYEETFIQK